MAAMATYQVPVVVERDGKGYHAYAPSIRGCRTFASTYEKALAAVQDAIRLNLELMQERGEPFENAPFTLTTVSVAV
jgi:predicted RNase H-like HicB family nuclease